MAHSSAGMLSNNGDSVYGVAGGVVVSITRSPPSPRFAGRCGPWYGSTRPASPGRGVGGRSLRASFEESAELSLYLFGRQEQATTHFDGLYFAALDHAPQLGLGEG